MNSSPYSNRTVFITGASSGLGALFARELARQGYSLVLVARRQERMEALRAEINQQNAVPIEVIRADLSREEDLSRLEQRIGEMENLDLLVNNAGFGMVGRFARGLPERQYEMVNVHFMSTVRLSRAALPAMLARRKGAIINVSSLAAFFPLPGGVTYCATKAALVAFSQSLALELSGSGVQVQALCPGYVYTEFHETAEYQLIGRAFIPKFMWGPAEPVITESLKALRKGQVICIPGRLNQLLSFFGRNQVFLPFVKIVVRKLFRRR